MTSITITLELPEDVAQTLSAQSGRDPGREALEAIALEGYRSRRLTPSQVRRMLGFETRMRLHDFLHEHGVDPDYTQADLNLDLENLRALDLY